MATVLTGVVTPALKEIGVIAAGETPSAQDGADALGVYNRMVDQWAAERLQIHQITRTTWTISANDGSYTVGSGADVNIVRPMFINSVGFIDTSTDPDTEYPLHKLTDDEYAGIPQKLITSPYPQAWHYNPTFTTGTLTFWPVPTSSTLQGAIYHPTALTYPATLATSLSVPPGYEELMVTSLAVRLAAQFGRQVDPDLRQRAAEARAIVKRANIRPNEMSNETASLYGNGRAWSIFTGP